MKLISKGQKNAIIAQKTLQIGPSPDHKNPNKPMSVKSINMQRVSTFSGGLNAPIYMSTRMIHGSNIKEINGKVYKNFMEL